jgi:ankyrin repeat protein
MRVSSRPHCAFRSGVPLRQHVSNGCKVQAFFKFGKNGADSRSAGAYGNLSRDDFDRTEMEHYFNYTGRLAVEQTYDTFNKYEEIGMHPVDVILLWASEEGDLPKVEEVLEAGADVNVKDLNGKTPLELASSDDVKEALTAALARA